MAPLNPHRQAFFAIRARATMDPDFQSRRNPHERRRRALAKLDEAPFSWPHIHTVIIAGLGLFTSAYEIFAINMAVTMLGIVYWQGKDSGSGKVPFSIEAAIKVATLSGAAIGHPLFGWLADRIGRRRVYGYGLVVIIFTTLGQVVSSSSRSLTMSGLLIFWRVVMGVGIGGNYPVTSLITSEFATTKWRGATMGAVLAIQGFGQFAAVIVALVVTVGFKQSLESAKDISHCTDACQLAVDKMWRFTIGLGAIPACFALFYRLAIPETPRFSFDVTRDIIKADKDVRAYLRKRNETGIREPLYTPPVQIGIPDFGPKASWSDFYSHYSQWKHGKVLLGTTASWLFLGIAFYGLDLNNSITIGAINWTNANNIYEILYRDAVRNLTLICGGSIPGYLVTIATVDKIGRKRIQLLGFLMLSALFAVIGLANLDLNDSSLLALYALTQFCFNFGPYATIFILPGECFPTRYRGTAHGISAAVGMIGALIAQCVFLPLVYHGAKTPGDAPWLNHVMVIFSGFMLCGFATTFLIPETRRQSLEVLCGEVDPPPQTQYAYAGDEIPLQEMGP
ncbi:Phosphate permease [Penicillium crustosum]|uniref:Phosphate permease n=1 Tax=Penicillium crustosum TaxID=36656 RepID=UPI002384C9B9|nr:Phosphate permease [Penicillium crustosum]KAJ5410847.1 Phosphate permease [Penicillium crustosum]